MSDPRSLHGFFYQLQDINAVKRGRISMRIIGYDERQQGKTDFVVRMTCSTPPALEFPLSFVKSNT
jgi:hypothetical protein